MERFSGNRYNNKHTDQVGCGEEEAIEIGDQPEAQALEHHWIHTKGQPEQIYGK